MLGNINSIIAIIVPHLGEKPHRCQLCPFASAYERHLEAHMRSHTGEKPYKCDLCTFCCSDRSNLSHHRRRRHKLLPTRVVRSPFTKRILQKRTSSLGFSRRLLNFNNPSVGLPKSDYLNDLSYKIHNHLNSTEYKSPPKVDENESHNTGDNDLTFSNPLDQLSTLAGQLADLHPESRTPASPDRESLTEEKPILIEQVSSEHVPMNSDGAQTSSLPTSGHMSCSPVLTTSDKQLSYKCQHCNIQFLDNILYTIHMGCHGYEHPFQCNVCGDMCVDRYDFACHFARGEHKK